MSRIRPEVEDTKTKTRHHRRRRRRRRPTPEDKLGQWENLHKIHHHYLVPFDEFLAALERLRYFDRLQGDVVCGAADAAALAASNSRHIRGFPSDPH